MSSLAHTIDSALANIGKESRGVLLDTLDAFDELGLPGEERVSAIATLIGASAVSYHHRHVGKFLNAVQVWALEAASAGVATQSRPSFEPEPEAVSDAGELLAEGLEALLDCLHRSHVPLQDRVISELTLYTRLLAQHDSVVIIRTISAIADAITQPDFAAGDEIMVSFHDNLSIDRGGDLTYLRPHGVA
jgi:DNA mismatch repair protein MutH